MSDPSVTVAEAFKQFSQVTVAAVRPDYRSPWVPSLNVISSCALTSMGPAHDSTKPRTICASCDTNATTR